MALPPKLSIDLDDSTVLYQAHILVDEEDTALGTSANPINVTQVEIGTITDISTTVTAGNTAQTLVASDPNRFEVYMANPHTTESVWFSIAGTAAANTAGSEELAPGESVSITGPEAKLAVSIIGTVTGQPITARRRL